MKRAVVFMAVINEFHTKRQILLIESSVTLKPTSQISIIIEQSIH